MKTQTSGNEPVIGTVYNKLYSRGKTTGTYVAGYGLGRYGLGYRVLVGCCDTVNQDDRLRDYLELMDIDRGFDSIDIAELPRTDLSKYHVVLFDGGRDTPDEVTGALAELAKFVLIPIENQKDIRNLDTTIQALNGHRKGVIYNRVTGDVPVVMLESVKAKGLQYAGKLANLSHAAHAIVMNGSAPHVLAKTSAAAAEFHSAALSLATDLQRWLKLPELSQ